MITKQLPFRQLGKTWEATKSGRLTFEKKIYVCKKQARPGNLSARPILGTEFHGPARSAVPVQTSAVYPPAFSIFQRFV